MRQIHRWIVGSAALALLASAPVPAQTETVFPTRPVRFLVPYAPGGATDIVARLVGAQLGDIWGQPVLVENRTGASGNICLEAAARATPDGYTVMVGNVSTNAINPIIFEKTLGVKPLKDLVPVAMVVEIPHIVAVSPKFPADSLQQLIDYAKAHPDQLNYGSAGIGSYPHLDMVNFAQRAGFRAVHVPYKGGAAPMLQAIATDEVQLMFVNLASSLPFVRSGRMKVLATTWYERLKELPAVPTLAELGYADIGTNAWNGVFAPAATPRPILERLQKSIYQVLDRADIRENYAKQLMMVPRRRNLEELAEYVNAEAAKWRRVIRDNHIEVEQ
jgi:tripartite-type tricarboxylate transporter receptor subunit TctC